VMGSFFCFLEGYGRSDALQMKKEFWITEPRNPDTYVPKTLPNPLYTFCYAGWILNEAQTFKAIQRSRRSRHQKNK
jgi:hypothetical protein